MIITKLRHTLSALLAGYYDDLPNAMRYRRAARTASRDNGNHRPHVMKLLDPLADHVIVALIPERAIRCFLLDLEEKHPACTSLDECMEAILTNLHEVRRHQQSGDNDANKKAAAAFVRIAYRAYEAYTLLDTHGKDEKETGYDW